MSLTDYQRKRRKQLVMGLPAVFMGCACLLGVIAKPFYAIDKKIHRYRTSAITALEEFDESKDGSDKERLLALETAQICYEKIWQLDPNDHNNLFYVAFHIVQRTGNPEPIERLAPLHEARAAVAHRWLARQLLASGGEPEQIHTHLTHLDSLKKRESGDNFLWYAYHARVGNTEAAAQCLAAASKEAPSLLFDLWRLQFDQGAIEEANETALKIDKWTQSQIAKSPNELVYHSQRLSVLAFLKRPGDLLDAATVAMDHFAEDEGIREQFFSAVTNLIHQMSVESKPSLSDFENISKLVGSVLARDEAYMPLRIELDRLFKIRAESEFAKGVVDDLLASRDPKLVTVLAGHWGAVAAGEEDYESAQRLLELAIAQDPTAATAKNNLAWVLFQIDSVNTDRAMDLVNRAVELAPDDVRFIETRGQILMARQEWKAAIKDLETAVNRMPDSTKIHRSLAKAYGKMGMTELAKAHER